QTRFVQGGATVQLVLVDPQGFGVLSTSFLNPGNPFDAEAVLTSPGTYTLLLEGDLSSRGIANLQFTVSSVPDTPPTAIDFGHIVDTSISQPGEQDVFTFTLPENGAIYMDAMNTDDFLRYTLTGPLGTIVNSRDFTALESIFNQSIPANPFPAVAGEYTIT